MNKIGIIIINSIIALLSLSMIFNLRVEFQGNGELMPNLSQIVSSNAFVICILFASTSIILGFILWKKEKAFSIIIFTLTLVLLSLATVANILAVQGTYNETRFLEKVSL